MKETTGPPAMIPEELMKKVRQLEIATRRSVSEVFAGEYSSAFRGRGMEFSEVREYQPGDDIRTIDWNVTARQGAPFIKRYVEERELTVMLVVDLSASQRFGSIGRTKREAAAELCGVVALAATKNNDKVGLLIFTDRVEAYVPPAKGMKHVLRILRDLLGFEPPPPASARSRSLGRGNEPHRGTEISTALEFVGRAIKRRSIVFLVSDFLIDEQAWTGGPRATAPILSEAASKSSTGHALGLETALRLMNRRHDVVAACMLDERERRLPPKSAGLIELEDAETGRRMIIDTSSPAVRRQFEALAAARRDALRERLRRLGVDQIEVSSHESYVHALIELFRRREHRR